MKINLEKISNRNKNTSSELCFFFPCKISTGSAPRHSSPAAPRRLSFGIDSSHHRSLSTPHFVPPRNSLWLCASVAKFLIRRKIIVQNWDFVQEARRISTSCPSRTGRIRRITSLAHSFSLSSTSDPSSKSQTAQKKYFAKRGVVSVHASPRQFPFQRRIARRRAALPRARRTILPGNGRSAVQHGQRRRGNGRSNFSSLRGMEFRAAGNIRAARSRCAEKIERPGFRRGRRQQHARPDARGIRAANRLAIFVRFGQLQAQRPSRPRPGQAAQFPSGTYGSSSSAPGISSSDPLAGIFSDSPATACALPANRKTRRAFPATRRTSARFLLFRARFVAVHFMIARDHFRAAAAQPRHFAHALRRSLLLLQQKFSQQLVQAHQAHLRFFQRRKMQQVREFLFVAPFGIGARGPHHAQSRFFQHAHNVIRRSFSLRAQLRHQLPANLLDFRGSKARRRATSSPPPGSAPSWWASRLRDARRMRRAHDGPRCAGWRCLLLGHGLRVARKQAAIFALRCDCAPPESC